MNFSRINISLLVLAAITFGCKSTENQAKGQKNNRAQVAANNEKSQAVPFNVLSSDIAPEHARVEAQIVSIAGATKSSNGFPCNEHPCQATIIITKLMGYGSSFQSQLNAKQEIVVTFVHSLNPSSEVYPDRKVVSLPGLQEGSKFRADIKSGLSLNSAQPNYKIYTYEAL